MPIISYLAYPHKDKRAELIREMAGIAQCEILPAQNEDIIILITDTNSRTEEDRLKKKLENIKSLKLLAMVSGFNHPQTG